MMKHKIEAIDYLRGISILAIIIIHVIALNDSSLNSLYSGSAFLMAFRDILQFSVITIIICSGFSLYLSHSNMLINFSSVMQFYRKRLKRLLIPWIVFLTFFFVFHLVFALVTGIFLVDLSPGFIISSYLMIGGIGIGWLILLMIMLMIFFPFLKMIYNRYYKRYYFFVLGSLYLVSYILYHHNSLDLFALGLGEISSVGLLPLLLFISTFVLGWSLVYSIGFYLEHLYNDHLSLRKELKLTFQSIFVFLLVHLVYEAYGLNNLLYLNKYPPSPYYISFGLMMTYVLLAFFFTYKHFIHLHVKNFLTYFSDNSFWLFLWNTFTITLLFPLMALLDINIWAVFLLDLLLNVKFSIILVYLQKKIDIEIHKDKHHF